MTRRRRPRPTQGGRKAPATPATPQPIRDKVSFNQGKVIMHLAKSTYTTLIQVIAECVQNALDAGATVIDIAVDEKRRSIVVADNGGGVTLEKFHEALGSVGHGIKDPGSLGRFGLGLISPLDKCDYYTFSSWLPGESKGWCWTFRAGEIEAMADEVDIPRAGAKRHAGAEWNTIVRIHRYTSDSQTAAMTAERVEEFVQSKLGPTMRKRGVTCRLHFGDPEGNVVQKTIKPTDFTGEPFEITIYTEPDAGEVEFELYRARKTTKGRQGMVSLSEADAPYPITFTEFKRQAHAFLGDDVKKALSSGYFEGVIRAKKVELHPNRRKFVWNDAVVGLCIAIEQWFEDIGHKLYTDEQVQEEEARLQRLGVQTLDRLKDLLKLEESEHLRKIIESLHVGSIGSGHNELPSSGDMDERGLRSGQGGTGKPRNRSGQTKPRDPSKPKQPERTGDKPGVSFGPEGQHRKVVRDSSTGISICHEILPGSDRLWEIDAESAMIYINVRHPVFLLVEHADTYVLQLQEWIVLQALSLLMFPVNSRELLHDYADSYAREFVVVSILGSRQRRRGSV